MDLYECVATKSAHDVDRNDGFDVKNDIVDSETYIKAAISGYNLSGYYLSNYNLNACKQ